MGFYLSEFQNNSSFTVTPAEDTFYTSFNGKRSTMRKTEKREG
jgi:hypothetical protein